MRVVQVHNRYRSAVPSGENRVVDQEAEALTAAGHEVTRFERRSDDIEHWSRIRKAGLPVRIVYSREAYRDLSAALRAQRPDVVHVHNTFPLLSAAVLHACRDASVPVVATLHNRRLVCASGDFFRAGAVCHDCAQGGPAGALLHGCYRGSRAATVPLVVASVATRPAWRSLVSAYVFVSESLRDQLRGLDLAPDRVFVRHHLIPRQDRPAPAPEPVIVYAGRLDEAKGLRLLMAGWDRYAGRPGGPEMRLVIAGSGPLEDEVVAWAAGQSSVEMVGQVPGEQCAELVSRARAVVLPSICEETFGLVAVEAMAAGVPAIAADHGSFPELITPGANGVLFPPGDPDGLAQALADAAANPGRYAEYGRHARATYEQRFAPEQNLDELIEIYRFAVEHPV